MILSRQESPRPGDLSAFNFLPATDNSLSGELFQSIEIIRVMLNVTYKYHYIGPPIGITLHNDRLRVPEERLSTSEVSECWSINNQINFTPVAGV